MAGIDLVPQAARRFWTMLAHLHGGVLNVAELARSFGIREPAVRRHVDVLAGAMLVRQLQPWYENLGKRLVRSPKIYIAGTGVLHTLLHLRDANQVESHPKLALSWEWFALQQVVERLGVRCDDVSFWATHAGAELDLFVPVAGNRPGFEFNRSSAPQLTKSMHIALHDLRLDHVYVVHAGTESFPMADRVEAVAIGELWARVPFLHRLPDRPSRPALKVQPKRQLAFGRVDQPLQGRVAAVMAQADPRKPWRPNEQIEALVLKGAHVQNRRPSWIQ